jgi:hypothetical protein
MKNRFTISFCKAKCFIVYKIRRTIVLWLIFSACKGNYYFPFSQVELRKPSCPEKYRTKTFFSGTRQFIFHHHLNGKYQFRGS